MSTDTSLRQMPTLTPDYISQAEAVEGRLRGDPSLPLDEEPEEEPEEADEEAEEVHSYSFVPVCRFVAFRFA